MTEEEKAKQVKELETQLNKLKKAPVEKPPFWKPKFQEKVFSYSLDGITEFNYDMSQLQHINIIMLGNYYATYEEAEFAKNCAKFTNIYTKYLTENYKTNKKGYKQGYMALFDYGTSIYPNCHISVGRCEHFKPQGAIISSTAKTIKDAIDYIGVENFIKYVLRITDPLLVEEAIKEYNENGVDVI